MAEKCPQCGNEYLVEKLLKSGAVVACPNSRRSEEEESKPRRKGKAAGKQARGVVVALAFFLDIATYGGGGYTSASGEST